AEHANGEAIRSARQHFLNQTCPAMPVPTTTRAGRAAFPINAISGERRGSGGAEGVGLQVACQPWGVQRQGEGRWEFALILTSPRGSCWPEECPRAGQGLLRLPASLARRRVTGAVGGGL